MAAITLTQSNQVDVAMPAAGKTALFIDGSGGLYLKQSDGNVNSAGLPSQGLHAGEFLTTNGSTASWAPISVSPAGTSQQIQFNNGGSFGARSDFFVDSDFATGGAALNLGASDTRGVIRFGGQAAILGSDGNISLSCFSVGGSPFPFGGGVVFLSSSVGTVVYSGNFYVYGLGKGIYVKEGADAKQGIATLTAGTVTVSNTSVTADSRIFLTIQDPNGGTPGFVYVSARTPGTEFTIVSSNVGDTSIVAYEIFEPTP